jgi:nucleoside-diphosphate-sugar epimerase
MKVLVTGGTGFIGSNLVKRLLDEGHEVQSLDNYSTQEILGWEPKDQLLHYINNLKIK